MSTTGLLWWCFAGLLLWQFGNFLNGEQGKRLVDAFIQRLERPKREDK